MRKITDFIVDKRNYILTIFIIISAVCLFLATKVNINDDIAKYLPSTSPTRIGMDIMESDFEELKSSSFNIMFKGLSKKEKIEILEELKNIKNVDSIDYDNSKDYNNGDYTLYVINVKDTADSKTAKNVYEIITDKYKEEKIETSGAIAEKCKPVLHLWIVVVAITFAMIILIIMCDSYVEPFLFLFVIGLAVFVNKGTNIMFDSVSNITDSICAILQMALSMDYSIMLMNRYTQEKQKEKNKITAMKNALSNAFVSISSSSVTTIVGLLALVFMSFTIGKDLGFVLAKGVLLSLLAIFMCLPGLILLFDKLIEKTQKKSITFNLTKLGKLSFKLRYPALGLFVILFGISFLLKGNLGILYTSSEMDTVAQHFSETNQMAIIYKNKYEDEIAKYCKTLEKNQKIDKVLCYGNTINEKLTYDELKNKLNELGQDVDIDDYLLKIIYYNYYNSENSSKMTFNEFISFINNQVYSNPTISDKLDSDMKDNIKRLENFSTITNIDKDHTSKEIADILGIDQEQVESLFVLYNSKNINNKMTINEFVNFMNTDVLTNKTYSASVTPAMKKDLQKVSKFINKNTITQKMSSNQISNLFQVDQKMVDSLYLYYTLNNNDNIKLTLNEFANFILNDVASKEEYANLLDAKTKQSLITLQTFSNKNIINTKMNSQELSSLMGMDEESIKQIMLLYYMNQPSASKLSISEFINQVNFVNDNTNLLANTDISTITSLYGFTKNNGAINKTALDKATLNNIFNNINPDLVNSVYSALNYDANKTMTTQELLNNALTYLKPALNETDLKQLQLLKLIVDDTLTTNNQVYTSTELAQILNVESKSINSLYVVIDYASNNISSWKLTPNEFVSLILDNKSNPILANKIDQATLNQLALLSNIMNATNNNQKFTYLEISELLNINNSMLKQIYSLYSYNNLKLTPTEFTNFILKHQNDEMLAGKLTKSTLNELNLVNKIMNGVLNNKTYTPQELANMLGIKKDDLSLIYSLHDSKHNSLTMSLNNFVSFIINDVVTDNNYKDLFDQESISKLNTINGIMKSTLNNTKYTSSEIVGILNTLADGIDQNMIDLLYIYYGSQNYYDETYKLTVEEFVNYLHDDILKDKRFQDFIDKDMKTTIQDAKSSIKEAKDMLISKDYSRAIINTSFKAENQETFDFIKSIQDKFKDKDGIYVIGDSPMAYDMSNSFNSELNFITVLTMIAIFVVVAISFKSILIPLILVLIIQCAVYITMGILSLMGGEVYFIALLIVQSILMGATIDYAILYTSYYKEFREKMNIKEALINSYNRSIHTILTSSSILIIVTLIVGCFASPIAAKICKTLSQGTCCSLILVLFILPPILAACDKIIIKNKKLK